MQFSLLVKLQQMRKDKTLIFHMKTKANHLGFLITQMKSYVKVVWFHHDFQTNVSTLFCNGCK